MIDEAKLLKGIEVERKEHPWASDSILRMIAEDQLRIDDDYYEETEEDETEDEDEEVETEETEED